MKCPIIVSEKREDGEKVFEAFCPLFDDAETFSPAYSKREAVEEVAEIVQDEVDDLVDAGKPLPRVPSKEVLEKKYPKAKIFWVNIEEDETSGDEALFGDDDEQDEDDDDEDDFEEGSDDEEPEEEDVDDLELDEILDDDDE